MPTSVPPPSSKLPKSGGAGPYVAGVLVLGALIGGLVFWKSKQAEPVPTGPTAVVTVPPPPREPPSLHAPPPPPPLEEPEPDAGPEPTAKPGSVGGTPRPTACSKCGEGESSGALDSALRSAAQSAQGCYNRALRTSEVSGKLTVSVQVGATGSVCSASIVNDSVHSGEISSCVLGRFRGKAFPAPRSGCIVANIPISFTLKQ